MQCKEFKELKFQQNLQIEFTKNNEFFKKKILEELWFQKIKFRNIDIDRLLYIKYN